jgi:hypothetical protein
MEDFKYFFQTKDNTFNGYQMNKNVVPVENLPTKRPLANYQFGEICYAYLEKMTELCKANGIELILIKAPSLYPYWYDEHHDQIAEFAQEHGLAYYNLTEKIEEIGLDFSHDTYDAGLHLNLSGATKLSAWFAELLVREHGMEDHRSDPQIAEIYDEKLKQYDLQAN